MPTWQGMEFLERVFDALAAQEWDRPFDVHVVDSSSTDGTFEFLQERARSFPVPLSVRRIHSVEFDHGDTRNSLAARSTGDLLVFLTQDAIPSSPEWLATLARNFEDPAVGAAYCRNVPRPDARLLTGLHSAGDPGYSEERREVRLPDAETYAAMDAHERRLLYNFNDVASAIRRELWERHPFPRTWFGEDVLMARALLEGGYTVVYDAEATVEHSHDYDVDETRKRAAIDGRFNAEWLDRVCLASAGDVAALTERSTAEDERALADRGLSADDVARLATESQALRRAAFEGLYEGGRTAHRYPRTAMREGRELSLLYVVHGFPPETWAGTEVYTLNLAKEMQRRGHRVTVLTRSPGAGDEPDFTLREDVFEGLRVLRMTHRLQHANLTESYIQPRAEAAFRKVLLAEDFDLVHFQHLIHTSAGLVEMAREFGLATVVTCHDFWALCSRVQMIRPDGSVCPSNMGSGCYLCVKETGLEHVERAKKLDGTLGGGKVLEGLAALLRWGPSGARRRSAQYRAVRARETVVPAAYAAADLRISPSRFLRQTLLDSGAFDPHTFLFSDNGMRTDHIEALEKRPDPDGRVRFGFVGTLVWYKGGEALVRAMGRLAGRKAVLHVWGSFDPESDPHHAELERLARESGASVEFKGRFDNSRLGEVYAELDVLVVPSIWYENAPVTIREAFLTGTPVVTSRLGGMEESVRDGVDGLHFAAGDDTDLAQKLARFIDEPELLPRMTEALASDDGPTVKLIEDDAADTEARYRALCCVERPTRVGAGEWLRVPGRAADATTGPTEPQGTERLLLRFGASASYDLGRLPRGDYEIRVGLVALGPEPDVRLGGSAFVGGKELGRIEPFRAGGADRSETFRFELTVAEDVALDELGSSRLELVAEGDEGLILRVESVALIRLPGTKRGAASTAAPMGGTA